MAVFGVLALLTWRAVARTTTLRPAWGWALLLTLAYAVSDELHQGTVSGRHASGVDVGIDAAGALVAVGAASARRRIGRRRG